MRILMTTDTVGGVWCFTQELASGLLEEGCEIALVSFGRLPTESQASWMEQVEHQWGDRFTYKPSAFPLEWMQDNASAYEGAASLLLDLSGSFGADVVHSNQFCFGALQTTIPRVITAHSDVLSWAHACRKHPLEPSLWLNRYCSLVAEGLVGAAAIAAPTNWMLHALSREFRLPETKQVIANGRSIQPMPSVPQKLRAVTAGRVWDEAKNVAVLAGVSSVIPMLAVGETRYGTSTLAPLPRVDLLGALTEAELLSLFRESAIYICTSRYEPFGLAPLEAALCGCAVLANDIPSLREVWADAALYFTDAAALSAHLDELGQDAVLLAARQGRSLEHARSFSRDRMTRAYLNLFQRVIPRKDETERVCHVS